MTLQYRKLTRSAIAGLIIGCLAAPAYASNLFNSHETRYSDLSSFPKWTNMLSRSQSSADKRCTGGLCNDRSWNQQLTKWNITGTDISTIKAANDTVNSSPYVLDMINWGKKDFWASPLQFLIKDGDCEDYAITKYMVLKQAGYPIDHMRIAIVQDENLGILHSVLAVKHEGRHYILDNQITSLVTDRDIVHYRPIYSINEQAWWRHTP